MVLFITVYELISFLFFHQNLYRLLDSDDSSELFLATILAKENRIMTPNWYYSTELHVLNTNLIFPIFFHFTDNWHTVRMLSIVVMHIILAVSIWYFCRKAGMKKEFLPVLFAYLIPVSITYRGIVLRRLCYLPFLVISMFGFGFLFGYLRKENSVRKRTLCFFLSCLLAFISCVGGVRQAASTYIPMFFSSAILILCYWARKEKPDETTKRFLKICIPTFAAAAAGCAVNSTIMHQWFHFLKYELNFCRFQFNQLITVLNGFMVLYGVKEGAVNLISLVRNGIGYLLFFLSVYSMWYGIRNRKKVSEEYYFLSLLSLCQFLLFILIYTLTDMTYLIRYAVPAVIFSFLPMILFFRESDLFSDHRPIYAGCFIAVIGVAGLFTFYNERMRSIHNWEIDDRTEAINVLLDQGYTEGYAPFWDANIMTELTNGKIEVWGWNMTQVILDSPDPDNIYEWLQPVSHTTQHPQGKLFIFLNDEFYQLCKWKSLLSGHLLFENDFHVYGFESYEEMKSVLGQNLAVSSAD